MDKELFIPLKPRGIFGVSDSDIDYNSGDVTDAEDKNEPKVKIGSTYEDVKRDLKVYQFLYLIKTDKDLIVNTTTHVNKSGKNTNKIEYFFTPRYTICWVKTEKHQFYMKHDLGSIFLYDYKKQKAKFAPKKRVLKLLRHDYFTVSGPYVGNHTRNKASIDLILAQVKDYYDKQPKLVKKEKTVEVTTKVKKEKTMEAPVKEKRQKSGEAANKKDKVTLKRRKKEKPR